MILPFQPQSGTSKTSASLALTCQEFDVESCCQQIHEKVSGLLRMFPVVPRLARASLVNHLQQRSGQQGQLSQLVMKLGLPILYSGYSK